MRFWYEWDESRLAQACHELEVRQIYEQGWREARRRASRAIAVMIPFLVALIAVSFVYLSRRQVSDSWSVFGVCLSGGLLGGVMVGLRQLGACAHARVLPNRCPPGALWLLLPALLTGGIAGVVSAFGVMSNASHDSYRPQTLYLIALAAALTLARFTTIRFATTTTLPRSGRQAK
jgi:hypothetical protein